MAIANESASMKPWLKSYPSWVPHTIRFKEVPVYSFLTETASRSPTATALCFFGKNTSYTALLDEVKRVAGGLRRLGLKKGDRVAIMLPNCPQMVASYFGVLWAGGVVTGVNPLLTADELLFQLKDSGARFIIGLDQFYPKVAQVLGSSTLEKIIITRLQERLPFPKNALFSLKIKRQGKTVRIPTEPHVMEYRALIEASPMEKPVDISPKKDLATLTYTSGTTSRPKGVPLSHYHLAVNCQQQQAWLPEHANEQISLPAILPIFYIGGITIQTNLFISIGARLILLPRFDINWIVDVIKKYKTRWLVGNPSLYDALAKYKTARQSLSSLEECVSGGASLTAKVKEEFESTTGKRLLDAFGMAEASGAVTCNPIDKTARSGSVGLPLPDNECAIIDSETGEFLPPGQTGEIVIRGPGVMHGYWNRPEETRKALKNGWLHTGDAGKMDEDGFFYVLDRQKDMIIVLEPNVKHNVFPRKIEDALCQHQAVDKAAVIGVPDEQTGQRIKAFVVTKPGIKVSEGDLITWCRENLPEYEVPHWIEFRSELPTSVIGKVLRRVLMDEEQRRGS